MATIPQTNLFSWEQIDAASDLDRLRFVLESMSPAEAIEQMELLGHSFFLFLDADAGVIKLLYQCRDGNYGLIEPEIG